MGCTMMRKCHLNTCPVGVATQDPELRKKFEGRPEDVVNFFFMLAEEVRGYLARLGCRTWQEAVGRTEFLRMRPGAELNKKAATLNFDSLLKSALSMRAGVNVVGGSVKQDFELEKRLDQELIELSQAVLEGRSKKVDIEMKIQNEQRTFGATLSNRISLQCGVDGLPDNSINIKLTGSAGQSFCAFLMRGVTVTLEGDANDYVGKGLSGGKIVVFPPKNVSGEFQSDKNIIVGNVCLYGATSGKAFIRGMGAERFCVRNSGVTAVIEGCGDHGCEYMTGGRVVILGSTGRNFAAGMSGGIAYVLDTDNKFSSRCNQTMVDLKSVVLEVDLQFLKETIGEFVSSTGSTVGQTILDQWPSSAQHFIKVFPQEYKRVLKEQKKEKELEEKLRKLAIENNQLADIVSPDYDIRNAYDIDNTPTSAGEARHVILPVEAKEADIESEEEGGKPTTAPCRGAVVKRQEKYPGPSSFAQNKDTQKTGDSNSIIENGEKDQINDIEDTVSDDAMKKKKRDVLVDKTRGFVKYKRATKIYRDAEERQNDWEEIFDFKSVKRGLKTQAARSVSIMALFSFKYYIITIDCKYI